MSVSLVLDGDPEGCHAAAAALRDLAGTLDEAGTVAASIRGRSEGEWDSSAGERMRATCSRHTETADLLRGACGDLALRLSSLASAMGEVRAELDRARRIARSGGYNVGVALPSFEQVLPEGRAETALDHALAVVARAREAEAQAHADFAAALPPILAALTPPPAPEPATEQERPSLLGTVRGLLPDVDPPDLSSLKRLAEGLSDLPGVPEPPDLHQLFDRAATDGLRAGGAVAGLALCTRAKLPPALLSACAESGGRFGAWAGGKLLERSDAR